MRARKSRPPVLVYHLPSRWKHGSHPQRQGVLMNYTLVVLDLPSAVKVQTLKLLARIRQAANPDDLWRASDHAAGFVLGHEMVEALEAASIKGLYEAFDETATASQQEERK